MRKFIVFTAVLAAVFSGCATSGTNAGDAQNKDANASAKISQEASAPLSAKEHFEAFEKAFEAKDYAAAKFHVDKACYMDFAQACYADGQLYLAANNTSEAKERFKKACALKYVYACTQLGVAQVKLGETDAGLATMQKACEMKDGVACANLGGLYSGKYKIVKKDAKKSKAYYQKACEYGLNEVEGANFCENGKFNPAKLK